MCGAKRGDFMNNNIFQKKLNGLGLDVTEKDDNLLYGKTKTASEFVNKWEKLSKRTREKVIKIAGAGLLSLLVLCGCGVNTGCVDKGDSTYAIDLGDGEINCPIKNFTHPDTLTNAIYDKTLNVEPRCYFSKREYEANFVSSNCGDTTELIYIEPINKEYLTNDEYDFYAYAKHTLNGLNYYSRTAFSLYSPEEQDPDYLNDDVVIKQNTEITNRLIETFNQKSYSTFVEELDSALKKYKINIAHFGGRSISSISEYQDELNKKATKKFAKFIDEKYEAVQIINTTIGDYCLIKRGDDNKYDYLDLRFEDGYKNFKNIIVQTVTGIGYTKDGIPEIFHIQHRYINPFWEYEDYTNFYNKLVAGDFSKENDTWKFLRIYTSPINEASYETGETANNVDEK